MDSLSPPQLESQYPWGQWEKRRESSDDRVVGAIKVEACTSSKALGIRDVIRHGGKDCEAVDRSGFRRDEGCEETEKLGKLEFHGGGEAHFVGPTANDSRCAGL